MVFNSFFNKIDIVCCKISVPISSFSAVFSSALVSFINCVWNVLHIKKLKVFQWTQVHNKQIKVK